MDSYLVTVVFDVESDSPEHAAEDARQMASDMWPPTVEVRGTTGPRVTVDMDDIPA